VSLGRRLAYVSLSLTMSDANPICDTDIHVYQRLGWTSLMVTKMAHSSVGDRVVLATEEGGETSQHRFDFDL
jgi:hypothetical protein